MSSNKSNSQSKIKQKIKRLEEKNAQLEKSLNSTERQKKYSENVKVAKKSLYVCAVVALAVIFLVYIITALTMSGRTQGSLFAKDVLAVQNKDGKWGYINKTGQTIIDFDYDNAYNFSDNGLALVNKDGKWGFLNTNGKMAIDAEYDQAMPFEFGVSIVSKDGKSGLINSKGKVISRNPNSSTQVEYGYFYDIIYPFEEEYSSEEIYAVAVFDGKYGVIDNEGKIVLDFEYDELGYVNEDVGENHRIGNGYISYRVGDLWGYIDYNGTTLTNSRYEVAYSYDNNGYAIVYSSNIQGNGYVILNNEGKFAYDEVYTTTFIDRFDNGYYRIQNAEGKFGIIAKNSDKDAENEFRVVVEDKYDYLEYGNDNLLIYSTNSDDLNRKVGFIDYSGTTKSEEVYVYAKIIGDKIVVMEEDDEKYTILNMDLTQAFEFECDQIFNFSNGYAVFEKNRMFGYVSDSGKIIYEASLLFADEFKPDGFAIARDDNGYGVLASDGKWRINTIYQRMGHFVFEEV